MITSCRNTHINNLQCKQAVLGEKWAKAMKYRLCGREELERKNIILMSLIKALNCYKVLDVVPTFIGKLVFENPDADSVTITVGIGAVSFGTYSGTGDGEEIALYFRDNINDTTTSPNYTAEFDSNILYVWSDDASLSFATTMTVSSGSAYVTTNSVSEDYEEDILNIWNCLSSEEICDIIQYANILADADCGC